MDVVWNLNWLITGVITGVVASLITPTIKEIIGRLFTITTSFFYHIPIKSLNRAKVNMNRSMIKVKWKYSRKLIKRVPSLEDVAPALIHYLIGVAVYLGFLIFAGFLFTFRQLFPESPETFFSTYHDMIRDFSIENAEQMYQKYLYTNELIPGIFILMAFAGLGILLYDYSNLDRAIQHRRKKT